MNTRYTPLIIGLFIGIALGLLYGWVIHPVEREMTTPNSLQEKYHADLVLMIAEAYAKEENLDLVHQRLDRLGFQAYEDYLESALNFAQAHDFSEQDVQVLTNLLRQLASPAHTPVIIAP